MAAEWFPVDVSLDTKPEVQELVDLTGEPHPFAAAWLDPAGSGRVAGGQVEGGGVRTMTPPAAGPALLLLRHVADGSE
jgi:hypothetical protein